MPDLRRTHHIPHEWRIRREGCYTIHAHSRHRHCQWDGCPDRQEVDVPAGQEVILNVKSDIDDELHAHMGLDGYALMVRAGQRTTGGFRLRAPGSFVVESHYLGKTIVILNVRQVL
jgi:hypothetical protein